MTYTRNCPNCGCLLHHTQACNRNAAEKKGSICRACAYKKRDQTGDKNPFFGKKHTEDTKKKISLGDKTFCQNPDYRKKRSESVTGIKNPMYGKCNYQVWFEKYGEKEAINRQLMANKKLSEKFSGSLNPMYGKPSPQGSGNGWSGWYKGWFFRSLRELSYVINYLEPNGYHWESAERSEFKIEYLDYKGTKRTYRADFIVDNKFLIEVKPVKLHSSMAIRRKAQAAESFCKKIGLEYQIVDATLLSDEEIFNLRTSGQIKFTDRYEQMYKGKYLCQKSVS